jgi:hypothetical protein
VQLCKTFADLRDKDNATRLSALAEYIVNYNQQNYVPNCMHAAISARGDRELN